jgi:predicted GIY-YIG superfamily endonuclease
MHFVYILYSSTNDQYNKGYTSNMEVRVQQHNAG